MGEEDCRRDAADFACLTRLEESGPSARGQSANGFVACKHGDYLKGGQGNGSSEQKYDHFRKPRRIFKKL